MTIQSLQKIILLEEELLSAEKVEQEKAELWLKEKQDAILKKHQEELTALDIQVGENRTRAAEDAKQKATDRVRKAEKKAEWLLNIHDDDLQKYLVENLKFIIGKAP